MPRSVLVSGSIAYDRIMNFPGRFRDHIMPDKIHILNVCFSIEKLAEHFGGTGANIAYNLGLLGADTTIIGALGQDADSYCPYFKKAGIDLSGVLKIKNAFTAAAYIITDQDDNQITAFHPGAMNQEIIAFRRFVQIKQQILAKSPLAIIAPSSKAGMIFLANEYQKRKIPYIFDPGQALTLFNKTELLRCLRGAKIVIGNDYEISLIKKISRLKLNGLLKLTEIIITTFGAQGSSIGTKAKSIKIPAFKIKKPLDPTGAGDAYRAGLIKGLIDNRPLKECGLLASVCASFAVEKYGTQEHKFTKSEFEERLKKMNSGLAV